MTDCKKYLTVHGHFYQPPRENPWLEQIEVQDSAIPYHDWNTRICAECYSPNSNSKIVGNGSKVLDIVNNYAHMSFNMGATLLSWMEKFEPHTYERIIKADAQSVQEFSGHGNAIAQVYNHIIMPLANQKDKYTQTVWGIEDFKKRFGRMPEGIWLAETACDDETLGVLSDCGIKFTILSPYQAEKVLYKDEEEYTDVSNGEIDTTKPYKYNIKCRPGKSINLFFYNAKISQAVAFEELLKDGGRFVEKLKTGVIPEKNCLVNIATDGESYGHHTKFGDMALSYVLQIKAHDENFVITNYGEYLEMFPPEDEVIIKPVSSWSCCHGVGRWKEDCGCSTGGMQGWNQKWRKPLREALNNLRDKLAVITEKEGQKYFKNVWDARNDYIHVILERNDENLAKFFDKNLLAETNSYGRINALKIMEIQRQAMLMFTSCGWFFNEISGIETIQIMKYAARAMQLASDFSDEDLDTEFVDILQEAKSNIPGYGSGKDIWQNFVKPCIIDFRQIACLWAVKSLYNDYNNETQLYCYKIKRHNSKTVKQGRAGLSTGHIEITSTVTNETVDLMFALLQFSDGDFHCAIRNFDGFDRYMKIMQKIIQTYQNSPLTETIRLLDEYFGREYYTLKDIFFEERQNIINSLLKNKREKFQSVYREVYNDGRGIILHFRNLGLKVPSEFKLAAQYTLSQDFNAIFENHEDVLVNENLLQAACDINNEAKALNIELQKEPTEKIFAAEIAKRIQNFSKNYEINKLDATLDIFKISETLDINPNINEAQYIYFTQIYSNFSTLVTKVKSSVEDTKEFLLKILKLGDKLNINTDFYRNIVVKAADKMSVK